MHHINCFLFLSQLTWTALSTSRHVRLTDATQAQEVVVSYLPLSHIAAQMVDIWVTMKVGGATYFAQPDALKVRYIGCVYMLWLMHKNMNTQNIWAIIYYRDWRSY